MMYFLHGEKRTRNFVCSAIIAIQHKIDFSCFLPSNNRCITLSTLILSASAIWVTFRNQLYLINSAKTRQVTGMAVDLRAANLEKWFPLILTSFKDGVHENSAQPRSLHKLYASAKRPL